MDKESLCKRIIGLMKKLKGDEFEEFFISEEVAYENFLDLISKNPTGPCREICEELNMLLVYNDLRSDEMKEIYKECSELAFDLNIYKSNFQKKNDYEI